MTAGKRAIVAAIIVALGQIGFLSWIIAGRAAVLRSGREIVLKVEPVDPRDLLRGDYVRLGYEISNIAGGQIANVPAGQFATVDSDIFVRVKKGADGYWHPVSANFDAPARIAPAADEADVKGHVTAGWTLGADATIGVEYGIERFYLPEGEGIELQNDMRVRPFGVRVALSAAGEPAIKTLLDGDKPLYEEPLY